MLLNDAILRVNRGLGFLPVGHGQTADIIQCFVEAQRDLEKGKTLPRFLLLEDQPLTLVAGEHSAALPVDFLRPDDDNPLHYVATNSRLPYYLKQYRYYRDAVFAISEIMQPDLLIQTVETPTVYVIRQSTIDFITPADMSYDFIWNYYRKAAVPTVDEENLWLANAPEWLIGEAGMRMAMDKRDKAAVELFQAMMQKGRMAVYAEDRADEDAAGPIAMGANL